MKMKEKKLDNSQLKLNQMQNYSNHMQLKTTDLKFKLYETLIPLSCFCNKAKKEVFKNKIKLAYS